MPISRLSPSAVGRSSSPATATSHDSRASGGRTRWLLPGDGGGRDRETRPAVSAANRSRLRSPHLERARGAVSELRSGGPVLGRVVPRDDLPAVPLRRRAPRREPRGDRRRRRARPDVLAVQGRDAQPRHEDRQAVHDRRAPPALDRRRHVGRVARRAPRRRLRVARRGAGRLLDDAAPQGPARARVDAALAGPVPRPRRLRPLRDRRGAAGHVRLGRGRPPVRRAARLGVPVRGHLGRRRLARHARLRRRPGPRRLLRRAEARARRPRHRGPHGLEGPQVLREGAGAELPELRRRPRAEGPREHRPDRLLALRVDPRRQGRDEPARQVRGPPEAHGRAVQARRSRRAPRAS